MATRAPKTTVASVGTVETHYLDLPKPQRLDYGSEELADALRALGKDVELHIIDAPYGRDCILLEENRQTPMIKDFLARQATT